MSSRTITAIAMELIRADTEATDAQLRGNYDYEYAMRQYIRGISLVVTLENEWYNVQSEMRRLREKENGNV